MSVVVRVKVHNNKSAVAPVQQIVAFIVGAFEIVAENAGRVWLCAGYICRAPWRPDCVLHGRLKPPHIF